VSITQAWDVSSFLTSESMASLGRRSNKSVVMTRLFLPSSMAENFSFRGHETRTYLCACHLVFFLSANYKHMQEYKTTTIQSRIFAEKHLHITMK
jgi:hypothetical protein